MANINLISSYRLERMRLTRLARMLAIGEVFCVAVITIGMLFMGGQMLVTRRHVADATRRLDALKPAIRRIQDVDDQRRALAPKMVTLVEAQRNTQRWMGIMTSLQRSVPSDTWLTSLAVEGNPKDGYALKVNGVTHTQALVGETMLRLSQVREQYERVDLAYTRPLVVDRSARVEFELKAPLLPTLPNRSQTNAS